MEIIYPTAEHIIGTNVVALTIFAAKRSDKAEVLDRKKIEHAINFCKDYDGNTYDKAVILLQKLTQAHAFASGNRRTAFLVTKEFLLNNRKKFNISDDIRNARVMQGIRENYYSHDEIKEWLSHGTIKDFQR